MINRKYTLYLFPYTTYIHKLTTYILHLVVFCHKNTSHPVSLRAINVQNQPIKTKIYPNIPERT